MPKDNAIGLDLDAMDRKELESLRSDVDAAIKTVEARRKNEALNALRQAAQEHGFKIEDLIDNGKQKGARQKNPAKYADPESGKTWSGRGRQPQFIKAALASGQDIEAFRI